MLTASFTACRQSISSNEPEESKQESEHPNDKEQPPADLARYENLTPETLNDAAQEAEQIVIEERYSWVDDGRAYEAIDRYTRDGNKVKVSVSNALYPELSGTYYYDLDRDLKYTETDGGWTVEEMEDDITWDYITMGSMLFLYTGLGYFGERAEDGNYYYTDEAASAHAELNGYNGEYSVRMSADGSAYCITEMLVGDTNRGDFTYRITAAFGDTDLEFPEVTSEGDKPEVPNETDEDEQGEREEEDEYSPDALYEALVGDLTIRARKTLRTGGKEAATQTVYLLDGDKVQETHCSDGDESVRYIDMATGLEYYDSGDGWLAKGSYYTIREWVLADYCFEAELAILFDSESYMKSGGIYTMTDKAAAEMIENRLRHWDFADTFGESATFAATVEYADGGWIVRKTVSSADGTVIETVEYAVIVGDTSVTLPDERAGGELDTGSLLSPAAFFDALNGDADMIVTFDMGEYGRVFRRDGDKVKIDADTLIGHLVTYYDLGAGKCYVDGDRDGEWEVKTDQTDWQSLVNSDIFGEVWEDFTAFGCYIEVMFADVNFILQDGRYLPKEAFLKQCLEEGEAPSEAWYDEAPTYEVYFDYKDGVHTFSYHFFTADGRWIDEMILTLTFGDVTVQLP